MAIHQTPSQRKTVKRVMHEYKHGELKTARGSRKVKNPKQAIAIALSEAGASADTTLLPGSSECRVRACGRGRPSS